MSKSGQTGAFQEAEALFKNNFKKWISKMPKMIIIEKSNENQEVYQETITGKRRTIYNNEGYDFQPSFVPNTATRTFIEGKALALDKEKSIPIGYNVHLPPEGIKLENIIVEVYGGGETSFLPDENLSTLNTYLLNKGTAIIQLNLPDLFKLTKHQNRMSEELHQEIHACIDKFFHKLKSSPKEFGLESLKDKPVYLYGASFGGLMSIRHSELYPKTFDGYISHDGELDTKVFFKADLEERKKPQPWLNPAKPSEIRKIEDPILLLHNMDDNNVNAKSTLSFYQKLSTAQKETLARIFTTSIGNPIPFREGKPDIRNKGHFAPKKEKDFILYAETLRHFLKKGPSLSAVGIWRGYQQNIKANQFYKGATIKENFIAAALEHYKRKKHHYDSFHHYWKTDYKPLFSALWYAHELTTTDSVSEEIERLSDANLLTDDVLANVLISQEGIFRQFIEEFQDIRFPSKVDTKKALCSEEIISMLREYYLDYPSEYFIAALYKANPFLLEPLYPEFKKNEDFVEELKKAKSEFYETKKTQRKLMAGVWKQAAYHARKEQSQTKHPVQLEVIQPKKDLDKKTSTTARKKV